MSRKLIKASRRLQLIESNMTCIARLGLTDTTIADVAKTADMSRGIVNFYFESKEKMMRETLSHLAQDYQRVLSEASQNDIDRLKSVIDAHFAAPLCSGKRLAVWTAFTAHAASHAPYRTMLAAAQKSAEETLAAAGASHPAELLALIQGFWLTCVISPDNSAKPGMAAQCLEFARGSAAQAPRVAAKGVRKQAEVLPMFDLFAEKA